MIESSYLLEWLLYVEVTGTDNKKHVITAQSLSTIRHATRSQAVVQRTRPFQGGMGNSRNKL